MLLLCCRVVEILLGTILRSLLEIPERLGLFADSLVIALNVTISARSKEEIVSSCLDFLHGASARPKLDFDQFFDLKENTVTQVMSILRAGEVLDRQDVEDTITDAPQFLDKPFGEIADDEFREFLLKNLLGSRKFRLYFPIFNVTDFPSYYPLGRANLIGYKDVSEPVKRYLKNDLGKGGLEESSVSNKDAQRAQDEQKFLSLEVDAYGPNLAIVTGTRLAEEALHILRFEYQHNFSVAQFAFSVNDNDGVRRSMLSIQPLAIHMSELDELTQVLNVVLVKADATELEKRLQNGMRLFGLAIEANRPEIRFVLLTNALEGLLMTRGDGDSIRTRMAEKVSFLLEAEGIRRQDLFERVKKLYDRRSDFVHQNADQEQITFTDEFELKSIVRQTFMKLLELRQQGFETVKKDNRYAKCVDSFIDELKFN